MSEPTDAGWAAEVEELRQRRAWAEGMGGREAVERFAGAGKQTIRQRIDCLVDAGSFQEVGKLTGHYLKGQGDEPGRVLPAPYVMGLAKLEGRDIAIGGEDFTVRGGTSWAGDRRKGGQGGFVEDLAAEYLIPLVNLVDGAGGSVLGMLKRGHAVFPGVHGFEQSVALLDKVPVASAVLGAAAGGPAGRAVLSHFSVMVRHQSQVFCAGPAVVRRSLGQVVDKNLLGGAEVAVETAGTIDNVAESEADALAQVRRFLSFLPQNTHELPPRRLSNDPPERAEEALLHVIPRDRRQAYDMKAVVKLIADRDSTFEIQPDHGKSLICMLARLDGYSVGVIANNPQHGGGAMDVHAARKQIRFAELCDTFRLPLVFLVDMPGFMVGTHAEQQGTLREGMRAVMAGIRARVPKLTVVMRKCYGMGGMATTEKNGLGLKLAWPSAEWGSLPIEGGTEVAFRREIEAAADPALRRRELEEQLRALASPWDTAMAFGVEDIIDPRETRRYLCRFINAMQHRLKVQAGPARR